MWISYAGEVKLEDMTVLLRLMPDITIIVGLLKMLNHLPLWNTLLSVDGNKNSLT